MTVINRSVIFILVFSAKESLDGPFYLHPKVKYSDEAGSVWYLNVPVGHNTLAKTVKRLCTEACIKGNRTNHSLRVTTAKRGVELGIPDKMLMERTGHRSVSSLHMYQRASEEQKELVSTVLENCEKMGDEPKPKRLCISKEEEAPISSARVSNVIFSNCSLHIDKFYT